MVTSWPRKSRRPDWRRLNDLENGTSAASVAAGERGGEGRDRLDVGLCPSCCWSRSASRPPARRTRQSRRRRRHRASGAQHSALAPRAALWMCTPLTSSRTLGGVSDGWPSSGPQCPCLDVDGDVQARGCAVENGHAEPCRRQHHDRNLLSAIKGMQKQLDMSCPPC